MSRPQTVTQTAPSSAPSTPQRTNRMAIWSLVLSILTLGGAGSIAGIWLGAAAGSPRPGNAATAWRPLASSWGS